MSGKATILKIGKAGLRMIYAFMKLRPIRKKIAIISRQSDVPTEDIALLLDYFEREHPDVPVKVMCRKLGSKGNFSYGLHMLAQMWNMADSAVILLDSYCIAASILDHKRETRVIQMWHAMAALKKFGYQNLGMSGGRSREIADVMCMHRNYDHILSPSRAMGEFFCEAFDSDESKLLFMALPRVDLIMHPRGIGPAIRQEYGIDSEKELLLYVPTFRKSGELSIEGLIENFDRDRYVLVISPHPLDESRCLEAVEPSGDGSVIVDREKPLWQWLDASDRVITDYSAASLEAALTGKPLYFYVYDIDEYIRDEGLNIDPRVESPQITACDVGSLMELMDKDYPEESLNMFRERFFEVEDSDCTAKLGEYLYGLVEKNY